MDTSATTAPRRLQPQHARHAPPPLAVMDWPTALAAGHRLASTELITRLPTREDWLAENPYRAADPRRLGPARWKWRKLLLPKLCALPGPGRDPAAACPRSCAKC